MSIMKKTYFFLILYYIILIEQQFSCKNNTVSDNNNNLTIEIQEVSNDTDNNQTNINNNNSYIEEQLDSYINMNSYLLIVSMSIAYAFIIIKNLKMIIMKEKNKGEYLKVSSNEEGIEMAEINEYN